MRQQLHFVEDVFLAIFVYALHVHNAARRDDKYQVVVWCRGANGRNSGTDRDCVCARQLSVWRENMTTYFNLLVGESADVIGPPHNRDIFWPGNYNKTRGVVRDIPQRFAVWKLCPFAVYVNAVDERHVAVVCIFKVGANGSDVLESRVDGPVMPEGHSIPCNIRRSPAHAEKVVVF